MKKTLSLILSFIMVITAFSGLGITADAAADYTVLATDLSINSGWSGEKWLTEGNTEVWYRITIPGDGKFTFKAMVYMNRLGLALYNSDLSSTIIDDSWFCNYGNEVQPDTSSLTKVLTAGTYYIKISGDTGKYKISTEYTNYNVNDTAAVSYDNPQSTPAGASITGAITATKNEDWYKITVGASGPYTFKVTSYTYRLGLHLYNSDMSNTIFDDWDFLEYADDTAPKTNSFYKVLSPGTYYLKIDGDEGLYFFSWNALTPENCTHEFETTTVDPTCTEQGYKKHTCKICGYSYNDEYKDGSHDFYREVVGATYLSKGYTRYTCRNCKTTYTDNYTAKLKLDKPSISSIKKGKKKLTVNLSANYYRYDGVQVQYSTSKKFAKKSTKTVSTSKYSKVLKKLKGKKKYYVRVRAYKVVDGKKVYSGWSKTKSAKTK